MSFLLSTRTIVRQVTFISLISLTLPGFAPQTVPQKVTLSRFTAMSLAGQPSIYLEWETATEFDTVGFFVVRSDFAYGPYVRISDFIPHEGDTVTGAQYQWIDATTVLSQTYFYRLEEITANPVSIFYGPAAATAGSPTPPIFPRVYLPLMARSN